jgi:hypothetical protein
MLDIEDWCHWEIRNEILVSVFQVGNPEDSIILAFRNEYLDKISRTYLRKGTSPPKISGESSGCIFHEYPFRLDTL